MTLAPPQQPIIIEVDDTSAKLVQDPVTKVSLATTKPPFLGRLVDQPPPVENQVALDLLE